MIEEYLVLADRIRQELSDLEQVVARAQRAIQAFATFLKQVGGD